LGFAGNFGQKSGHVTDLVDLTDNMHLNQQERSEFGAGRGHSGGAGAPHVVPPGHSSSSLVLSSLELSDAKVY
jgi:hypothetical protein